MEEPRCAWCGEKLENRAGTKSFCGKACRRAHEDWCRSRAVARTQAVYRWRNIQVVSGKDMVNDLLAVGQKTPANGHSGPGAGR